LPVCVSLRRRRVRVQGDGECEGYFGFHASFRLCAGALVLSAHTLALMFSLIQE
jgi:hypothetical protein